MRRFGPISGWRRFRGRGSRLGLRPLAALLAVCVSASVATGTGWNPTLALSDVVAEVGSTARSVRLSGEFPADDLVQLRYPVQILIRETGVGAHYVRYDLSAGAVTGVAPELADGLDATEALALLAMGTPSPDARVSFLAEGRIEVLLPASFPSGAAEAQLYVIEEGQTILSNSIPFDLPEFDL